ncbi:condensation domain-containing protein [Streptomyces sp. Tue 6075]|uniref:condensation domain-containing protein n=1 Tax=Streptomyces sp. Tue 6075 TaxID=1661694 RepID=UPI00094B39E6|nr:condensation domain-containing protein [Streptomyces sp. Tue 6075]
MTTASAKHTRDRVTVRFDGPATGRGPATWGQTAIRRALGRLEPDDHQFNIDWGGPVEPGLPVETACDVLRGLLYVHDSLRTLLHEDGDGRYVQELHATGELDVLVADAETDDVESVAAELRHRLGGLRFDYAREWPLRVALVTRGGLVRHVVVVLSHTAVDGWGLPRLVEDITALVAGADPATLRAGRRLSGPMEEAAQQRTPSALRREASARDFVLRNLAAAPTRMYQAPGGGGYRRAVLRCPGLAEAAEACAARLRAASATVLLAAACAAVAASARRSDCVLQVMVNNRFVPGLADLVAPVALEGVLYVPDCREPFDDLVRSVWKASVNTYRFAYYDKDRLTEQSATVPAADTTCWYNDRRGVAAATAADTPDGAAPPGGTARDGLTWSAQEGEQGGITFALHVLDAPGALDLSLTADTAAMPPSVMEELLRQMAALVHEHAAGAFPDRPRPARAGRGAAGGSP